MGLPRNLRPGRRPSAGKSRSAAAGQRITVDDLLQFAQIRLKLKNEGELVEVVQLLLKLGTEARLKKILDKYAELANRHKGDGKRVEAFLLELKELGLNWDG